jgi:hypothetical protein
LNFLGLKPTIFNKLNSTTDAKQTPSNKTAATRNNNNLNTYRNIFLLPLAMENINLAKAPGQRVWLSDSPDIMTLQNHVIYNQHSLKYTVLARK